MFFGGNEVRMDLCILGWFKGADGTPSPNARVAFTHQIVPRRKQNRSFFYPAVQDEVLELPISSQTGSTHLRLV